MIIEFHLNVDIEGAVVIGAVNLLRLKPRLLTKNIQPQTARAAAAQLQINVRWKPALGTAVVIIVAVLGILPSAIH